MAPALALCDTSTECTRSGISREFNLFTFLRQTETDWSTESVAEWLIRLVCKLVLFSNVAYNNLFFSPEKNSNLTLHWIKASCICAKKNFFVSELFSLFFQIYDRNWFHEKKFQIPPLGPQASPLNCRAH